MWNPHIQTGTVATEFKVCFWNRNRDFGFWIFVRGVCPASSVQFHRFWMYLLCLTLCPSHFISYICIYAQHRHQLQRLAMPAGRQGPQKPSPPLLVIAGVAVQMWQNSGYYLDFGYSMACNCIIPLIAIIGRCCRFSAGF